MKLSKDKRGFTLIEVIAVVTILSIVLLFITSILFSTTKQHVNQSSANKNTQQLSYALKVITKDFRRSSAFSPTDNTLSYPLKQNDINTVSYQFHDPDGDGVGNILRTINYITAPSSEEVLATNVQTFLICQEAFDPSVSHCPTPVNANSRSYYIYLASTNGQSVQTNIIFRGSDSK